MSELSLTGQGEALPTQGQTRTLDQVTSPFSTLRGQTQQDVGEGSPSLILPRLHNLVSGSVMCVTVGRLQTLNPGDRCSWDTCRDTAGGAGPVVLIPSYSQPAPGFLVHCTLCPTDSYLTPSYPHPQPFAYSPATPVFCC